MTAPEQDATSGVLLSHAPLLVDWRDRLHAFRGNGYGYATASAGLKAAAAAYGVRHAPDADAVLHFVAPAAFLPVPGRTNILFTMWESPSVPYEVRPYLDSADLVIVPSKFCRDILAPYVRAPIALVPLGLDADRWPYVARQYPHPEHDSFQWLLVGAANARKGWDALEVAWKRHFLDRDDCHLYLKTTAPQANYAAAIAEGATPTEHPGVVTWRNIVLDFRNLEHEAMLALYHESQGFAFPTAGEGWGLTLMEAMATGLPAIATKWSGLLDFTSPETVRYVAWTPHEETIAEQGVERIRMTSAWVDPDALARSMREVMGNYAAARRRARRAATAIRTRFTWPLAGRALARVLARFAMGLDPASE